jgi:uncharacterized protein (DUF3820 family)
MNLTDTCPMPFGTHKGTEMANVPDGYLKWFWIENEVRYRRGRLSEPFMAVMEYIEDYGPENL